MKNIQKIISGLVMSVAIFSSAEGMEGEVLAGLDPNNISLQLPVTFPNIGDIQKTKNSLQHITLREGDGEEIHYMIQEEESNPSSSDNYSNQRFHELEVIYRSAFEEIKWVLENYPIAGWLTTGTTSSEIGLSRTGTLDKIQAEHAGQPGCIIIRNPNGGTPISLDTNTSLTMSFLEVPGENPDPTAPLTRGWLNTFTLGLVGQ